MKNRVMKNKQDFILKVENEGFFGSLNRFTYRRFDRATAVWSDCAAHNILMFVTEGEATCSCTDTAREIAIHRKGIILSRNSSFVIEFKPGCEVLTYSFDSYLPIDASIYADLASDSEYIGNEASAFDIPKALQHELVNIIQNIESIRLNEMLTHLYMRKVTAIMQKCMKPGQMAKLFAIGQSELGSEIFRYMKIAENRINLTKKSVEVIF